MSFNLSTSSGGIGAHRVPGIVPDHWWAKSIPRSLTKGLWGSQSWCQPIDGWGWGPGCPGAGTHSLVAKASFQGLCRALGAGVGLLVGGAGAQGFPGLVPASPGSSRGPSGGRGWVLGPLGAQGVLRQPACW